ncbi:protein kinase [Chloropicon primus]|uniref:Protein kinase n=2 Tax=Chloropicon primus TaxID=1764295 RepID=A0A5B8MFR1_9CHLO|nr:protein kinase [Chloropicon primus]UPQ98485.1 protein kinase [Chloropicon primus]|eukprot:QDZ19276.1 protein kinase [Chloropicon primus]
MGGRGLGEGGWECEGGGPPPPAKGLPVAVVVGGDLEALCRELEGEDWVGGAARAEPEDVIGSPMGLIVAGPVGSRKRKRGSGETCGTPEGSVESEYSLFVRRASVECDRSRRSFAWSGGSSDRTHSVTEPFFDFSTEERDYKILQNIGEGTFATVHLCDYPDKSLCDFAAIKCSKSPEDREEAWEPNKAGSTYGGCQPGTVTYEILVYLKLWSGDDPVPGIPSIFDYGELEDQHTYIAMQLLGPSWEQMIENGTAGKGLISRYLGLLVNSLEKIHESGIVHCDVKPKNILAKDLVCVTEPYLLDFGLSFHLDTAQRGDCREFIGTADYSSDDRLLSRRSPLPVDDMISLGYTALHAWLGDLPWRCPSSAYEVDSLNSDKSTPGLQEFQRERALKMEEGLGQWAPFFREWFGYCDGVAKGKGGISYGELRDIIRRNENSLAQSA